MRTSARRFLVTGSLALPVYLAVLAAALQANDPGLPASVLDHFVARPIGPANMGGRITSVAVVESDPKRMYVATASGGLWKTTNNGTTWEPIFDHQKTIAIGDVAVAPLDANDVWVGTGEANARNSVSWGDGVYRSTNGGKTWRHLGLADSAHIGRILLHPSNANVAYVAALGHLWGPNRERGLFKTTDGGDSWQHVLALDDDTGCIDLVQDPRDPETLIAAAYRVRRDRFSGGNPRFQFGPRAGFYKTTNGGKSWTRLTEGLPDNQLGRCGLSIARKTPGLLYAVVQTEKTDIRNVPGQAAATGNKVEIGGIFKSTDYGQTWTKLNDLCPRPFYFGQIRIDPNDEDRIYVLGVTCYLSRDGGKSFKSGAAPGTHGDYHALWIDPSDSRHLVLGSDGGLSFSYDQGMKWERLHNLPIGQFYGIALDKRKPYWVYGGLQDNGSWGGPTANRNPDGITNADWSKILGADGFQCQVDPENSDIVYAEGQYGRLHRLNLRNGSNTEIKPRPARENATYRFNWNAPVLVSPHDAKTVYFAGNHLFRSHNRGGQWDVLGPDLTRGQPGSASFQHTITAIAESPRKEGLLYVGTDDGRIHVSRDGGRRWQDISERALGKMMGTISRVECSHFDDGTAYLAFDRHREDDRRPYLFKTEDFGQTWTSIAGDLPAEGHVHVVREDLRSRQLLFVGTEFGLFVSLNSGRGWQALKRGLPTVAVHDLAIHPRDRDLVIATHGRSIFVTDIAPLEELSADVLAKDAHLCEIKPATAFRFRGSRGGTGAKSYAAPNPPFGASIYYFLRAELSDPPEITILDKSGKVLLRQLAETKVGLHRLQWLLRTMEDNNGSEGPLAKPGEYQVQLRAAGQILTQKLQIEAEP